MGMAKKNKRPGHFETASDYNHYMRRHHDQYHAVA